MIAMILIAVLYLYVEQNNIYITADELAAVYQKNIENADDKFLNKNLELSGEVKSYYFFENQPNLLELKTENSKIKIYCSFLSSKDDSIAGTLTIAAPIIIIGIFEGNKDHSSPDDIYIEVSNISIDQNQ